MPKRYQRKYKEEYKAGRNNKDNPEFESETTGGNE